MASVKFPSDSSGRLPGKQLRAPFQLLRTDRLAVPILMVYLLALYEVTIGYGFAFDIPILLGQIRYL